VCRSRSTIARRINWAWPTSARALSGRLRELVPSLRAVGIEVVFPQDKGKGGKREAGTGNRVLRIRRMDDSNVTTVTTVTVSESGAERDEPVAEPSQCKSASERRNDGGDGSDGVNSAGSVSRNGNTDVREHESGPSDPSPPTGHDPSCADIPQRTRRTPVPAVDDDDANDD